MSIAAVFLDIEKAFDTLWHPGLLYKLSTMEFSTNLIKLISSFLLQRKFRVSVEGKMSTPRDIKAGVLQGSILSPTLYNLYINDTLQIVGINLALHADDTSLYATECKERLCPQKYYAGSLNDSDLQADSLHFLLLQSGRNMKLTTHLHLVPTSRMVELYLLFPIRLHNTALNLLGTGAI
jgi:hypothetical protein